MIPRFFGIFRKAPPFRIGLGENEMALRMVFICQGMNEGSIPSSGGWVIGFSVENIQSQRILLSGVKGVQYLLEQGGILRHLCK